MLPMLELLVVMEAVVVRKSAIMVSAAVPTTMIWSAFVGAVDDIVSWVREPQVVNTAVVTAVVEDKRQLTGDGSGVNGDSDDVTAGGGVICGGVGFVGDGGGGVSSLLVKVAALFDLVSVFLRWKRRWRSQRR
jgi:hypothetical protein